MWDPTAKALRDAGHDVDAVSDWTSDTGAIAIPGRAVAEQRILVTLDNEFGELAIRRGLPHAGMIPLQSIGIHDEAEACLPS